MEESADLRASDQERERVAEEIREHFAAGRLTSEELDERLRMAYAARTTQELEALRVDLPSLPPSPAEQRAELGQRRARLQRRLVQQTGGGLVAFIICTVIWLAAGASGAFWPVWVAIAPVIALLNGAWGLYGPAPELEALEQRLERRERHRERALEERHDRRERHRGRRGRLGPQTPANPASGSGPSPAR